MSVWNDWEQLWRERYRPERLEEFARVLEAADVAGEDALYEKLWRQARLEHFRAMQAEAVESAAGDHAAGDHAAGDHAASERGRAAVYYRAGEKWAVQAAALRPFRVEAQFWRGVNLLEAARCANFLTRWRTLKPAEAQIQRAEATDETYHFAGPLRVHGRITHYKPLILGGSLDAAIILYRRALQVAPDNSTTLLYYADALLADRQRRAAREIWQRIMDAPDAPEWRWEQERDRRCAAERLAATERE